MIIPTGIRFYQRHLSPLKGFRCAHAARHGGPSCSHAVLAIVEERGLVGGWPEVRARFAACRLAYADLRAEAALDPQARVRGLFCCGPVPIPFRCG